MTHIIRKPEWAECELRIVPEQLPHRFSYKTADHKKQVYITLNERGAVIDKVLEKSNLPISMVIPANAFKGIAARAMDDGMGNTTVTLELHHFDPGLCIPLLVDTQLHTIASDWRTWSQIYNLPMLMVETDGVARPLDQTMAQISHNSRKQTKPVLTSRYHRSTIAKRRPRFLVRRKIGLPGCQMKLSGREIIARY